MTREEALKCLKTIQRWTPDWDDRKDGLSYWDAIDMALAALSPASRERVEKVWKGEWKHYLPPLGAGDVQCRCTRCGMTPDAETPFCAWCGAAMTSEAVDIVMERLEALKDGKVD